MKRILITVALLAASSLSYAVNVTDVNDPDGKLAKALTSRPVVAEVHVPTTTSLPSNMKIVGYRTVTSKYYGWGGGGLGIFGKKKKSHQVPIFEMIKPDPVSAVPEPSTWMSMAAGLGLVGFVVYRQPRRSAF